MVASPLGRLSAGAPVTLLVDARNVLRSRWPNLKEDEVVRASCAWAAKRGCVAVVVFDGRAPADLVGERELDEGCLVVGTGGESADDWIARAAAAFHAAGRPYWLVTSDRELRARAGESAARVIGGGSFVGELGRSEIR